MWFVRFVTEKLAEEPTKLVKAIPAVTNVNKWDGEDEGDVKVNFKFRHFSDDLFQVN